MAAPIDSLRRKLLLTAGGLTASGLVPRLSSFALPQASAQAAATYRAGTVKGPRNLFSHSDQQLQWQGLVPGALFNSGWGGRVADRTAAGNPTLAIPGVISLDGDALFTVGETTVPLALPGDGGNGLAGDPDSPIGRLRLDSMRKLLVVECDYLIVAKAADTMDLALRSAETVNAAIHA